MLTLALQACAHQICDLPTEFEQMGDSLKLIRSVVLTHDIPEFMAKKGQRVPATWSNKTVGRGGLTFFWFCCDMPNGIGITLTHMSLTKPSLLP